MGKMAEKQVGAEAGLCFTRSKEREGGDGMLILGMEEKPKGRQRQELVHHSGGGVVKRSV